MSNRKPITEESGEHKEWYERARSQTLETLPAFLKELSEDYSHDYGTICHALSAAAIAAAWAMNKSECGGITGFQAGCVMWGFISHWNNGGEDAGPMRLTKYENMLYPQYEEQFKTISKETHQYLIDKAKAILSEKDLSANVRAHLNRIASGVVPFGYTIS